jgi:glucose/arabinose dehydrogenase
MLEFGSDGYLYFSDGDGGPQGDPMRNGQNTNTLLGKIMRIDVDTMEGGRPYGIPDDNPYADGVDGAPEVFMYGLRNPWRWSFDSETGDMYIGDVGWSWVEEIHVVPAANLNNADLGWFDCEGTFDQDGDNCNAPTANRLLPVVSHIREGAPGDTGNSNFNAIIGGQVYRGTCFPDLVGRYFYSDNGAGGLWSFVWSGSPVANPTEHPGDFPNGPTSIHADATGELYLTTETSGIYRIVAE